MSDGERSTPTPGEVLASLVWGAVALACVATLITV